MRNHVYHVYVGPCIHVYSCSFYGHLVHVTFIEPPCVAGQEVAMRPILLKGHDGPLTCVKYNKDGDLLFTTCRRGRINLWYSDDGERMGTYNSGAKPGAVMYVDVNCESPPATPPPTHLLAPCA
jgi:WD40 repeat protein